MINQLLHLFGHHLLRANSINLIKRLVLSFMELGISCIPCLEHLPQVPWTASVRTVPVHLPNQNSSIFKILVKYFFMCSKEYLELPHESTYHYVTTANFIECLPNMENSMMARDSIYVFISTTVPRTWLKVDEYLVTDE